MLEQVSIFIRLFGLFVDQWNHGANLIVPNVFFKHQILILTHLLYLTQDVSPENLIELSFGSIISVSNIVPLLLGLLL